MARMPSHLTSNRWSSESKGQPGTANIGRMNVGSLAMAKAARYAVKGNAWQNVFPTHLRAYQDWWARLQAA